MLVEGLFFSYGSKRDAIHHGGEGMVARAFVWPLHLTHRKKKKIERLSYEPLKPITSTIHPVAMPHH